MESPFSIPHEDVVALEASPGFHVLRRYLANNAENTFCVEHDACNTKVRETWLLHRDILHALIMPVVQLFRRASVLAEAALCTRQPEDLELAFGGDARSAFLWLQCFIAEEEDWCRTRGCPACITTAALSTESHIRLTIAASLLSTFPSASTPSPSANSPAALTGSETPPASPTSAPTPSGLSLPPFPHILPALREALAVDPFWGPDYWSYLLSRASILSAGMQILISECGGLEALVSSPSPPTSPQRKRGAIARNMTTGVLDTDFEGPGTGTKLRKSRLAKRQLRMKGEEMELLKRRVWQCWGVVAVPAEVRKQFLERGDKRRRSLTCP
ncbi:hypothetical protein K432DRAFT_303071 [Lepidopterella palustris CBS 459.81]|uniref:Uncharacterized protein n=1 Tax=Lepidopterella palustris CBS 459.81 TaxID=1314670 RepID=A0A8E2E676_9PEZI|nr:hypothetical protein K432DRAFT_303071 [Lepidopterella palustris CBS 459.81]